MPRTVEIVVPRERTDALVADLRGIEPLIGLQVQRGVSIKPQGDVVTLSLTNRTLPELFRLLERHGLLVSTQSSVTTSEPLGIVSTPHRSPLMNDASEANWEEVEHVLAKEGNMTVNGVILMAVAGYLATTGIVNGTLHYVIAGMVIAPAFEPLVRIGYGLAASSSAWKRGLFDTAVGFLALVVGAALAAFVLDLQGTQLLEGQDRYVATESLLSLWTSFSLTSILVSAAASVAGAVLIAANRSVLTAGVLIALLLIPAAAIVPLAAIAGDWDRSGQALLRWALEAGLVVACGLAVFGWKRVQVHRRASAI